MTWEVYSHCKPNFVRFGSDIRIMARAFRLLTGLMHGQRKIQQSTDGFSRREGFSFVDGGGVMRAESALRVTQWMAF